MKELDCRNADEALDRCGGHAVIAGTRTRVQTVLACYPQGMAVEAILQEYPQVWPADLHKRRSPRARGNHG